jgi:hypothetical protein
MTFTGQSKVIILPLCEWNYVKHIPWQMKEDSRIYTILSFRICCKREGMGFFFFWGGWFLSPCGTGWGCSRGELRTCCLLVRHCTTWPTLTAIYYFIKSEKQAGHGGTHLFIPSTWEK